MRQTFKTRRYKGACLPVTLSPTSTHGISLAFHGRHTCFPPAQSSHGTPKGRVGWRGTADGTNLGCGKGYGWCGTDGPWDAWDARDVPRELPTRYTSTRGFGSHCITGVVRRLECCLGLFLQQEPCIQYKGRITFTVKDEIQRRPFLVAACVNNEGQLLWC